MFYNGVVQQFFSKSPRVITEQRRQTAEQREERLGVWRARDRSRRAAQTAEERDARLRQIRDNRRQSLATESEEERAVRLQRMRDRLASETEEERAARLQRMSANQPAAPHQPHRTSRSARACASIAFELTLAPTMLCIHLVIFFYWGEPERAPHGQSNGDDVCRFLVRTFTFRIYAYSNLPHV